MAQVLSQLQRILRTRPFIDLDMGKYIDAEKLKRFVESIGLTPQKSADYNDGRDDVKMVVLDFIDSLQQDQLELDLEIERIVKYEEKFMNFQARHQLIGYVARHFYNLGLNARKI